MYNLLKLSNLTDSDQDTDMEDMDPEYKAIGTLLRETTILKHTHIK